jgi:hypothetical protein
MPDTVDYVTEDRSAFYGDAAGNIYIASILQPPFQPPDIGPGFHPGKVTTFKQLRADVVNFIDDEILWRSGVPPTRR